MAAWGYEFYLLVLKALEDKIHIPTQPCNILYIQKRRKNCGTIFFKILP